MTKTDWINILLVIGGISLLFSSYTWVIAERIKKIDKHLYEKLSGVGLVLSLIGLILSLSAVVIEMPELVSIFTEVTGWLGIGSMPEWYWA